MRLHTDVYRYFIVDVLVFPPKRKEQSIRIRRGFVRWGSQICQNSIYVQVPILALGGEVFYHDYYDYYSDS